VAKRLSRYPDIPLGHANPDRWNRIEASMLGAGALLRTVDADEFLYDPDAEARNRTDFRAFAILGVTLLAGIVAIALLWLRRQRRTMPAKTVADAASARGRPAPKPRPERAPSAPAKAAPPQPLPADLNSVLARLERTIRQRLPRGVNYRASFLPELWPCRADATAIRPVVLALVAEAGKEIASGGQLVLGTRNYAFDEASIGETPGAEVGEFVRLTVRDSGPGLSDEALDQVFDLERTRRPAAAQAAETMRQLGGFIRVESAEGVGTAVHLYLPRSEAAPATQDEKVAAAAAE
jgi:hypothetical protein